MSCSAIGYSAVLLFVVLEVLGSNPRAYFFFLTFFFFFSQGIFEDIADQIEKNFQSIIASTLSDMLTFLPVK